MYQAPQWGKATRKTASGATVLATGISTVAGVNLIGIAVHASVTGNTLIQLWAGTTATATAAGLPITGVITFVSATATGIMAVRGGLQRYMPIPAYASGGLCLNTTGDSTDITIYWNPSTGG